MFKKVTPDYSIIQRIPQFPHCDSRVLHAPGECQHCDKFSEWQALRMAWGIAFTGWEPEDKELPDPAAAARGLTNVNRWGGNIARPKRTVTEG